MCWMFNDDESWLITLVERFSGGGGAGAGAGEEAAEADDEAEAEEDEDELEEDAAHEDDGSSLPSP